MNSRRLEEAYRGWRVRCLFSPSVTCSWCVCDLLAYVKLSHDNVFESPLRNGS